MKLHLITRLYDKQTVWLDSKTDCLFAGNIPLDVRGSRKILWHLISPRTCPEKRTIQIKGERKIWQSYQNQLILKLSILKFHENGGKCNDNPISLASLALNSLAFASPHFLSTYSLVKVHGRSRGQAGERRPSSENYLPW